MNADDAFDIQTAVMDALPHAIHPIHDNWRAKADALIQGLADRGYVIIRQNRRTSGGAA